MGTTFFVRNRYWLHRSLYDDYTARATRVGYGFAAFMWLPHYWYGVYLNRANEEKHAHSNYEVEYGPRRQRMTENLLYQEFDVLLEQWIHLNKQNVDSLQTTIEAPSQTQVPQVSDQNV